MVKRVRMAGMAGVLTFVLCSRAFAACPEPREPAAAPNGATASREEMIGAQKAFRDYDAAVRDYSSCLANIGANPLQQNEVVARLQKYADKLNAELRAFKKKPSA